MARRLRCFDSSGTYFVTAKTFQGRLLLLPDPVVTEIIGGVLARGQQLYGIEIFGFVALSNHVHILCRSPDGRLAAFMQHFLSNVARKVGRYVSWPGQLWQRRYAAEPVVDDGAHEDRLRYILKHGVKEGLVETVRDWPGLSCLPQLLGQPDRVFRWFSWRRRWVSGRLAPGGERPFAFQWAENVTLKLAPLPHWSRLDEVERRQQARELVDAAQNDAQRAERPMGLRRLLRQPPHSRPRRQKRSIEPICHATTREAWETVRLVRQAHAAIYREASRRFRDGDLAARFPPGSSRPYIRSWERGASPSGAQRAVAA